MVAEAANNVSNPEARNAPGLPELAEPSPLLRWTSDGSMMDELLKSIAYAPPYQCHHLKQSIRSQGCSICSKCKAL